MSEHQDHVRQSFDGQHTDPGEDLGTDEMRWSPAPATNNVTDEEMGTAADMAHDLLFRAADAYLSLLNAVLGEGTHHVVVSSSTPYGEITEGQELTVMGDALIINEEASMRICAVIAAGMLDCSTGGLVVRTFGPNGSESVRGWRVENEWLKPLTAPGIEEAYCVDPETGAPLASEPGVEFRQAEPVPRPDEEQTGENASHTAPRDNRPPNRRN
jgi:hypothetical protein